MMGTLGLGKIKPRELPLMFNSGSIAGTGSRFGSAEISEPYTASIKFKLGRPSSGLFEEPNASKSAGIVCADAGIAFILATSRRTQILNAIAVWLPVYVVDLWRHIAMHEKPCETMGEIIFVFKSDPPMPGRDIYAARHVADCDLVRRGFNPPENARVGIVGQIVAYFSKAHEYNNNSNLHPVQALEVMI